MKSHEQKYGIFLSQIELGALGTNCYCFPIEGGCVVIDPAIQSPILTNWISANIKGGKLHIYLTHGHFDHIGGVNSLLDSFPNSQVYIYSPDFEFLSDPSLNLSALGGLVINVKDLTKVQKVNNNESIINGKLKVLALPGHTPGCSGLYDEQNGLIFEGDTLFNGGIGRTDFPKGNHEEIQKSIKNVLFKLPPSTVVFPGHGPSTTIAAESANNSLFY
ncbi:MBL fold metallo-hydrolase [Histomonas meleagridis]|uniref:MBL fold metallo-hydrolase n=1 Tax=Histomonas meleagridis TaxID=135588 RepID=UPI00355A8967|nr:MBL fold metallo-hydrolase [Histomonas meleagridis]KAH0798997.1 MBL fold metallo-hydrolase [Histomonas meleagridis]